jgi:lysine-N-methylase
MASVRHLPLIQNWDCHQCGTCCTDYWVPVSAEERARIAAQGWEKEPGFEGKALFKKYGSWWRPRYRLAQVEGDRCIFLDDQGLCRIHSKFGIMAKPFACRLYPYVLVPVGDHWRVSMRFACPSVAANKGRCIEQALPDIRQMAQELESWDRSHLVIARDGDMGPPPYLTGGQRVSWNDLDHFVNALLGILRDRRDTIVRRLLRCLALARICQQARFDKLTGPKLREFLAIVETTASAEAPRNLDRYGPPTWIGRVLFRTTLALFLRKDQGMRRGVSRQGRIALMVAMWRMVRGRGRLPRLQIGLPEKTFAEYETSAGPLSPESEEALERYYVIKVQSLQFCGRSYYNLGFWEGFHHLAMTLPMICWAARGYKELGQPDAIFKAITLLDENFGYNPLLGRPRHRISAWVLSFRQELEKLVAWYGR